MYYFSTILYGNSESPTFTVVLHYHLFVGYRVQIDPLIVHIEQ